MKITNTAAATVNKGRTAPAGRVLVSDDRYERAARPCPEEFRAAYIHLLKELEADIDDRFAEDNSQWDYFERSVLTVLVTNPDLDPWDMTEITECFPECRDLSERLRMLSRLWQRGHV